MINETKVAEVLIADATGDLFRAAVDRLPANVIVRHCVDRQELENAISSERAAVVVIGALGPGPLASVTAAYQVREMHPSARVILVADSSSEELLLSALRAGVAEFLKAPLTGMDLADAITRFLPSPPEDNPCSEMIGSSESMRDAKFLISRFARINATVLITGETGTGKEIAARLIHRLSARSQKPLVCVNCAAIPDTLLESELFGYERGAFTGALTRQPGHMRLAEGGTLFLDEIGDLSMSAQAKILRAIECHEVQPLGGARPVPVDFRTIAATHHDLEELVAQGRFRSDLFFRLNVAALQLPPLRNRPEDIPALARHFLRQINQEQGRNIEGFTPSAMRRLTSFQWPGNARQLRNTIEAAALMCDSHLLSDANLRALHCFMSTRPLPLRMMGPARLTTPSKMEPEKLVQTLEATNWNITRTAEILSWSRVTVYRKLAEYQLERKAAAAVA